MSRYTLYGGGGSPYSQKMRAILHYRRLPFDWIQITPAIRTQIEHDGPPVIPILRLPEDGSLHVDSTPLAMMLEERHSRRSIRPTDPAMDYLSCLIEDMADEWVTKMMFHYRWDLVVDQEYSSRQIMAITPGIAGEALVKLRERFVTVRYHECLWWAALHKTNPLSSRAPRALSDPDSFATRDEYLFGTQPSLADFGLFGQLKTLASDHTPMMIMRTTVPSVTGQTARGHSGIEGDWHDIANMTTRRGRHAALLCHLLPAISAGERHRLCQRRGRHCLWPDAHTPSPPSNIR